MPYDARDLEKLNNEKAALFTRDGQLLWTSGAWSKSTCFRNLILGIRYQEFIHPKDLPGLLEWLNNENEQVFSFRTMLPCSGKMAFMTCSKLRYGEYWLIIGNASFTDPLPAPNCLVSFAGVMILAAQFTEYFP